MAEEIRNEAEEIKNEASINNEAEAEIDHPIGTSQSSTVLDSPGAVLDESVTASANNDMDDSSIERVKPSVPQEQATVQNGILFNNY